METFSQDKYFKKMKQNDLISCKSSERSYFINQKNERKAERIF